MGFDEIIARDIFFLAPREFLAPLRPNIVAITIPRWCSSRVNKRGFLLRATFFEHTNVIVPFMHYILCR